MKRLMRVVIIALLVGLIAVAVDARTANHKQSAPVAEQLLLLGLPDDPRVWLTAGGTRSYERLIAYQPPEIEFSFRNDSQRLKLDSIERIQFVGESVYVEVEGKPMIKIRGGESNTERRETWRDIPLESFRVHSTGAAELNLAAAIKDELRRIDIRDLARSETYVVDEIAFEGSGTMTLEVTIGTR